MQQLLLGDKLFKERSLNKAATITTMFYKKSNRAEINLNEILKFAKSNQIKFWNWSF